MSYDSCLILKKQILINPTTTITNKTTTACFCSSYSPRIYHFPPVLLAALALPPLPLLSLLLLLFFLSLLPSIFIFLVVFASSYSFLYFIIIYITSLLLFNHLLCFLFFVFVFSSNFFSSFIPIFSISIFRFFLLFLRLVLFLLFFFSVLFPYSSPSSSTIHPSAASFHLSIHHRINRICFEYQLPLWFHRLSLCPLTPRGKRIVSHTTTWNQI